MRYILILVLVQLSVGGMAQFRKPLSSPSNRRQSDDALFNLGVLGGPNTTHWHIFDVEQAEQWFLESYQPHLRFDYFGGLTLEVLLGKHLTAGLSAIYARHEVNLQYTNEKFPYDWSNNNLLFKQRHYDLSADYQTIEAYLPLTFYLFTSKDLVRPYFYVAPRCSYVLDGDMVMKITDSIPKSKPTTTIDTASFAPVNHIPLNVGATVGLGTQFRISLEYYYFLIKMDVSATWNFLNTYSKQALQNEFYNKRYDADAQATITFMFPLKKRLYDACHIMR